MTKINTFIKQFTDTKKMMKMMSGGGGKNMAAMMKNMSGQKGSHRR